jgi:hypothetical protein
MGIEPTWAFTHGLKGHSLNHMYHAAFRVSGTKQSA